LSLVPSIIASEAKQSSFLAAAMDFFVAQLLAMTARGYFRFRK
jgi:hypothetical protein